MTGRRTGVAAAVAAAALTVAVVPAAHAAAAAAPKTVALQVQYPDATRTTWCVPYRAGMTGADVLAVANPTYGTGPYAGFVLKIGGQGTAPTSSRYWAYWESPNGKKAAYAYSASGVTSTHPRAGSVEAWVWNTSSTTTPRKASYASLCPTGA